MNIHLMQMAVDELEIKRMMARPCRIVMHPYNYARLKYAVDMYSQQGHIVESNEECELSAVYLQRLEDETK